MNDATPSNVPAFPHGLRVFLRSQMPDGSLHNVDFPEGRNLVMESRDAPWVVVVNIEGTALSFFSTDSLSFVLPLVPVGPGPSDAKN